MARSIPPIHCCSDPADRSRATVAHRAGTAGTHWGKGHGGVTCAGQSLPRGVSAI
ncbi:hypothetical protein BJV78DRAFT_1209998 [Lactifluus subvellereus]|nr:hypothetical protein BJV78DRAFT_1209998 [Lactifluus subvellereus]